MIVVLLLILLSGYKLLYSYNSHFEGSSTYEKLEEEVVSERSVWKKTGEISEGIQGIQGTQSEEAKEQAGEAPIKVDFPVLKEKNSSVIAWIYIEALDISYPVMQASDNDYFLHRTVEGNYNFAGSIFMDCENKSDFSDGNTIIYGHNMSDGSMFGRLKEFNLNQAYLISPYIWIITEQGSYRYEVFSTQVVNVASDCYTLFEETDDIFLTFMERMRMNSNIETEIRDFQKTDRVVTLSTCAGDGEDSDRYVVQAVR